MEGRADLDKRCGSCARFVRVTERVDENGEVRRSGDCLLQVWPPPLYETNTCSQYVKRGTFAARPPERAPRVRHARAPSLWKREEYVDAVGRERETQSYEPREIRIPEELLDMNADEFREVLRDVIRDELGVGDAELGGRWQGGEIVMKPGKEGTQEKRIPIESLFRKIVGIRDKLRVLEQKLNSNPKLNDEEKVQLQQYVTGCYGSLTTFNVLFADRADAFVGAKGDKDD